MHAFARPFIFTELRNFAAMKEFLSKEVAPPTTSEDVLHLIDLNEQFDFDQIRTSIY